MSIFTQRRSKRFGGENNFMSYHAYNTRSRTSTYQPHMTNYHQNSKPHHNTFQASQYLPSAASLLNERAYLLTSLQREDLRATSLLASIADINARLESGVQMRFKEAKMLRKTLGFKRHSAEMRMRQEKWILQRLGEVTFLIQQRERWERVDMERRMGMGGQIWGGWNGFWMADVKRLGQQAPCINGDIHSQNRPVGQEWYHQLPASGLAVEMPATPVDSKFESLSGWQTQTSGGSPSCWPIQTVSENDATRQQSPSTAKSESMVEPTGNRRGDWNRMSVPDLTSGSWNNGEPRYLGYFPRRSSEEISAS